LNEYHQLHSGLAADIVLGTNRFGEVVFALVAIVLGLIIVFAMFKSEWLVAKQIEGKYRN
jgi:hypothetical protein